jgi:hypothetical protein
MHTTFWLENFKGRDQVGDTGLNWIIILKRILEKNGGDEWAGLNRLRIRSNVNTVMNHRDA